MAGHPFLASLPDRSRSPRTPAFERAGHVLRALDRTAARSEAQRTIPQRLATRRCGTEGPVQAGCGDRQSGRKLSVDVVTGPAVDVVQLVPSPARDDTGDDPHTEAGPKGPSAIITETVVRENPFQPHGLPPSSCTGAAGDLSPSGAGCGSGGSMAANASLTASLCTRYVSILSLMKSSRKK